MLFYHLKKFLQITPNNNIPVNGLMIELNLIEAYVGKNKIQH